MSFTGNGGGRFQIRRIRNGATTESFIFANGPSQQDFSEPTGFHTPNWNNAGEGSFSAWDETINYALGAFVKFGAGDNEGVYTSLIADNLNHTPTLRATDDFWQYRGPEGDPLIIVPQLLVDGTMISLDGTQAASPVNAKITNVQWMVLANGTYQNIVVSPDTTDDPWDTVNAGFSLFTSDEANMHESDTGDDVTVDTGTNRYLLGITRNLNNSANFPAGSISDGRIFLRARITYEIQGVTDTGGNVIPLMADAFFIISRVVLTESSMFSRILLVEKSGQAGSTTQIWNSGFVGDKRFQADLILGAVVHNSNVDNPDHDVTYRWFDAMGEISQSSPPSGISFPTVGAEDVGRYMDVTREAVATSETFYCEITEVTLEDTFTSNTIELRDFLDPVQFIEQGTSTVDVGGNGRLSVIPYQNGRPMEGLDGLVPGTSDLKCVFDFTYRRISSADDTTGSAATWTPSHTIATRFPGQTGGSYQSSNSIARTPYDATIMGATIVIFDDEITPTGSGVFVDYEATFTMVAN